MAQKAKPGGRKPGAGKSVRDQVNSIRPEDTREAFDALHTIHDDQSESNATFRGRTNRVYDKVCKDLDVSKDALKAVYQEERQQRTKAANAAKMDTRGRDSMERLGASLGETPMGEWATRMARQKSPEVQVTETKAAKPKKEKKASNVVPMKKAASPAPAAAEA